MASGSAFVCSRFSGITEDEPDRRRPQLSGIHWQRFRSFAKPSTAAAVDWKPVDRLRVSAEVRYRSAFYADEVNSDLVRVPGAAVVSTRAEYAIGRATAFAYARNLFDKFVYVDRTGNALRGRSPARARHRDRDRF